MSDWICDGRPRLHFAPKSGWINDPNGLYYDGKQYHLFAQHNPNDTVWGPMHWLHAVSDDLCHWKELGIVLYPNDLGTIFSGSTVIDVNNTAGFGQGAVIAMYTQDGKTQCQSIAYSLDGMHFEPYERNPVIANPGISDFRDPKVFWYENGKCWAMVLAAKDCIEFYRSKDMRTWEKTGSFGKCENRYGQVYECPDLFPLIAPDGRKIWVLLVSMAAPPEDGGGRMQYYLGEYDGETFHRMEEQKQALMVDTGFDNYAGVTYNGTAERIYMGWAASPVYAGNVPAGAYRGCMTLPRRLSLMSTEEGLRLAAEPMLEGKSAVAIQDGDTLPGGAFELNVTAEGPFEIRLENRIGEYVRFGLDEDNCIFTDRTNSGAMGFDASFGKALYSTTCTPRLMKGPIHMRVVMDHTLAEFYADDGVYVNTTLLFPSARYSNVSIQGNVAAHAARL
jgi:fructan beta-fructosidase